MATKMKTVSRQKPKAAVNNRKIVKADGLKGSNLPDETGDKPVYEIRYVLNGRMQVAECTEQVFNQIEDLRMDVQVDFNLFFDGRKVVSITKQKRETRLAGFKEVAGEGATAADANKLVLLQMTDGSYTAENIPARVGHATLEDVLACVEALPNTDLKPGNRIGDDDKYRIAEVRHSDSGLRVFIAFD